ncbi:MAG: tetratricopeptide repeat protein [Candidatus Hydrogenedentota bacterium]
MQMRMVLIVTVLALLIGLPAQGQWRWTPETGRWVNIGDLPRETPELQLEHARRLMLEDKLRKAMRETEKFDRFYGDTEFADDNQFLRGEILLAQGKDLQAAKAFQQVATAYPDTELFDEVIQKQYAIGDRLYEQGLERLDRKWWFFRERPLKRAAEVYEMVVENRPFTTAAAEAQYKIGLCHFARENYYEASYEYRRVLEDYSGSEWVDEASYGLAQCYIELALPPAYDQSPSRLAIRAIDDFKTRFPRDERVDALMAERAEMRENIAQRQMEAAKFYEKRRDFAAAKLYYEIIVADYADTETAQEAQTWIEDHPGVEAPFAHGIGRERTQ